MSSRPVAFARARSVLLFLAVLLPWLNPFAPAPSPSVVPWLFSVLCGLAMWVLYRLEAPGAARRKWPELVAAGWLVAALASSGIALLQYFGAAAPLGPWVDPSALGEAYGNLRQRNQFATLSTIGLAALLWWAPRLPVSVACAATVLLAGANAASSSRTGLLQIALLGVLAGVLPSPDRRRRTLLCFAALGAYGAASLALPALFEYVTGQAARSIWDRLPGAEGCSSRTVLWSNVIDLIKARPWLGWGWGELDFAHFMALYDGERFCAILDNAHNLPLHVAVELGIPAALVVCAAFAAWSWRQAPWREADATRQLAWSVLAVVLVHSLVEYPLWYGPFQLACGLSAWLLCARRGTIAAPGASGGRRWPPAQAALALLVLLATLAALADYQRVRQIYLPPEARSAAYRVNPLAEVRRSFFFDGQLRFAQLTTTPLTAANARWTHDQALALLHYTPEPAVVEKVIESSMLLGLDEDVSAYALRYKAVYPQEYARWYSIHGAAVRTQAAQAAGNAQSWTK